MAKRLRLTPPQNGYLAETGSISAGPESKSTLAAPFGAGAAPIARVAADAATSAAFDQVSDELRRARVEGRLIQALPLDAVVQDHLVRDRVAVEPVELASLSESIRARGQQTPIEVVDLGQGRYGLISGWRRLAALRGLLAETGDARFATVLALLRTPADAASAYVSMVEENEIRVGLSYYERARIVAKAVEQGVFQTPKQALQSLFSTASRAKRSKIGSFLIIVAALDGALRHPTLIGERTGLALAQALEVDPALAERIRVGLTSMPVATAEAEQSFLASALRTKPVEALTPAAVGRNSTVEVALEKDQTGLRIVLTGNGVDADLHARLQNWLVYIA